MGSPATGAPIWAWPVVVLGLLTVLLSGGQVLGMELGSLPDWVEAIGSAGALIMAVYVLRVEQRNRITGERERQARQVGGYIARAPDGSPDLIMTVTNSSPLAVRDVRGYVTRVTNPGGTPWEFSDIPVLTAGKEQQVRLSVTSYDDWKLELEFDDDAGVRWRKYAGPLQEVPAPR